MEKEKRQDEFERAFNVIKEGLRRAAITLKRLPDYNKPQKYRNLTPIYIKWGQLVKDENKTLHIVPSPKEIDFMDKVLEQWLKPLDAAEMKIVWGYAIGIRRKVIANSLGYSTKWVKLRYDKAITKIICHIAKI